MKDGLIQIRKKKNTLTSQTEQSTPEQGNTEVEIPDQ